MKANFDANKSPLELQIEQTTQILERTHPEQKADAMEDYASALSVLRKSKDIRVKPLITSLKRLYVYPTRAEHNRFLIDLYDLKELLYETRINDILVKKANAKANLGEVSKSKKWPWLVLSAIALFILLKP